jgi:predicted PurR-regulated permease PerM
MNIDQRFLFALVVISGVVSLLIVLPFMQFIIGSVLIAYVLYPINQRLEPYLGTRVAPLAVMAGAVVVVFTPVAYITAVLLRDLRELSQGESGLRTEEIEETIAEETGREVDVTSSVSTIGEELSDILFGDIAALVSFGLWLSIGFALMLFVVYYLVRDGDRLVAWLIEVAPMANNVCGRLFRRIDDTTWGVVVGHLFVAVLQGLVGGVGLFVAGVPNAVFWTFVMIVLALLPLIGAAVVWAPASGYLFVIGDTQLAVALFLYGLVIVSLVDNYARPIVIDREAELNPAVILVGVFGGTYAIGMTGLFVGPIVLAVFVTTVEAFNDEYRDGSVAPDLSDVAVGPGETAEGDSDAHQDGESEASGPDVPSDAGSDGADDSDSPNPS